MNIIKVPKLSSEIENLPFKLKGKKVYVNYYDEGVQAGFPSPADDFKELPLSLDEKYLQNPDSTFLIRVKGNSMYPTLHVGDILVVKSHLTLDDNTIGIVSVNNTDFTVKRLDKMGKKLIADNPEFENIQIEENDIVSCLGVVRHLIRDFN